MADAITTNSQTTKEVTIKETEKFNKQRSKSKKLPVEVLASDEKIQIEVLNKLPYKGEQFASTTKTTHKYDPHQRFTDNAGRIL